MGFKNAVMTLEKHLGFKNEINWETSFLLIWCHSFGAYWCWHYAFPAKFSTILSALIMFFISGMGITCGVHRLFTHRSYKVVPFLKLIIILCYSSAGQNSIYQWVLDHRLHHKFSDTEADPHNANRGLFFSHIGWLMMKKNEEVKKQGKKIDMSDITSDRMIMLQHRYFILYKTIFCYILPTSGVMYLCGETWRCAVAWQCFIRFLLVFHSELTVNSFAHIYGYTPYNKNIFPKQNIFVSTVTFGEGWHNYHHMFPFDYKAAEFCDALNWSAACIKWWESMGLAYDLKEASPEIVEKVAKKLGDDSYIRNQESEKETLKSK